MVQFARYLGVEVRDNTNYDIVYGALLKKARHNSAVFNKRWDSRARSFAEHFYSGLALGVITEDANNGYMYEGITLGISKADAIKFLAKDKSVFSSISTALDEKDTAVKGVVATVNVKEKVSSDKEEDDNNFE